MLVRGPKRFSKLTHYELEAVSVKTMEVVVAFTVLFVFFAGLWWLVGVARQSNKTYSDETLPVYRESLELSREQLAASREAMILQREAIAATREAIATTRELIAALREKH